MAGVDDDHIRRIVFVADVAAVAEAMLLDSVHVAQQMCVQRQLVGLDVDLLFALKVIQIFFEFEMRLMEMALWDLKILKTVYFWGQQS